MIYQIIQTDLLSWIPVVETEGGWGSKYWNNKNCNLKSEYFHLYFENEMDAFEFFYIFDMS